MINRLESSPTIETSPKCSDDCIAFLLVPTPLINGPASDYSAIFTGLLRAYKVSSWTCGSSAKTVISLDLDLYEK